MNDHLPHGGLLLDIERFCAEFEIPKTRFGLESVRDASFVTGLENGRECRRKTLDRVSEYMRARRAASRAGVSQNIEGAA